MTYIHKYTYVETFITNVVRSDNVFCVDQLVIANRLKAFYQKMIH